MNKMKEIKVEDIKEFIKNDIKEDIQRDEENYVFYKMMINALSPFQDKKITKRIATKLKKTFPEHFIEYHVAMGMYNIIIFPNKIKDNSKSFNLGHKLYSKNVAPTFDIEKFKDSNICYGKAAKERVQKNKKILENDYILDDLCKNIKNYINIRENLKNNFSEINDFNDGRIYNFLYGIETEFNVPITKF